MSYFYSSIQGQAGEATRTGSRNSGIRSYVQTWNGRVDVHLDHSYRAERDQASIGINGGPSGSGTHRFPAFDLNTVAAALDSNDPKFDKILARIDAEFQKLDAEAPKAVKREERRRKAQKRDQLRAQADRKLREAAFALTITQAEVEHYLALVLDGPDQDQRGLEGIETDDKVRARMAAEGWMPEHKPFRNDYGDLIVNSGYGSFRMAQYNVTQGFPIDQEVYAA